MGRGTTLADPVTEEHRPDFDGSLAEISEYLDEQNAHGVFDFLLKELIKDQPADPIQHMINCLKVKNPTGPLQVIMVSPPGIGRSAWCKRLAETFGLVHICTGELLRGAGVDLCRSDEYASDDVVSPLVVDKLKAATASMQGFILDGFPRTRVQASHLKGIKIAPTHVLVLKADEEAIMERNRLIKEGELEGQHCEPEALARKLNLYTCHANSAHEAFLEQICVVPDALGCHEDVWGMLQKLVLRRPLTKGPTRRPRVVLLGPHGVPVSELSSRLAARLGTVLVDAEKTKEEYARPSDEDPLEAAVLRRLRQPDCAAEGWVLMGFPKNKEHASTLCGDRQLKPTRVISLQATEEACVDRQSLRHTDPITGQVWWVRPKAMKVRKRLIRRPEDTPAAIREQYKAHVAGISDILAVLPQDGRCTDIDANGPAVRTFGEIVDFVERGLPPPEA